MITDKYTKSLLTAISNRGVSISHSDGIEAARRLASDRPRLSNEGMSA